MITACDGEMLVWNYRQLLLSNILTVGVFRCVHRNNDDDDSWMNDTTTHPDSHMPTFLVTCIRQYVHRSCEIHLLCVSLHVCCVQDAG